MTDYGQIITIEPGKRGGRPCVRGLRIAVADVLGWLAAGMSHDEIRADFPEITETTSAPAAPTRPTASVFLFLRVDEAPAKLLH